MENEIKNYGEIALNMREVESVLIADSSCLLFTMKSGRSYQIKYDNEAERDDDLEAWESFLLGFAKYVK